MRVLVLALSVLLCSSPAFAQLILPPGPSGGGVPVGGSGTANNVAKFTATTTLGNALLTDDGTNVSQPSGEFRLFGSSTLFTGASTNSSGSYLLGQSTVKPAQPTAALAGAGAGNVDNGTHVYCVTFITATGETECSVSSAAVTVADKTVNGKVTVTFTVSGFSGVTGRNVYRSKANTTTPIFLVATSPVVNNNSATTYTDNIADASLTATQSPSTNTTNDARVTMTNAGALSGTGTFALTGDWSRTGTFTFNPGVTLAASDALGVASGAVITFAAVQNTLATFGNNAGAHNTSGNASYALFDSTTGTVSNNSSTKTWVNLQLNPTINHGGSNGNETDTIIAAAPKTTSLTGTTLYLLDVGTTTDTYYSGFTTQFRVKSDGTITTGGTSTVAGATCTNPTSITVKNGLVTAMVGTGC